MLILGPQGRIHRKHPGCEIRANGPTFQQGVLMLLLLPPKGVE